MIKDSGNRTQFKSGAVRDVQEGKGRCDLLPLAEVSSLLNNDFMFASVSAFKETGDTDYLLDMARTFVESNPYHMMLEVAIHFEEGANKYGDRNWEKGIPVSRYIDSGIRHYLKYMRGDTDERHDRAFVWNMLCAVYTIKHFDKLDDFSVPGIKRANKKRKKN